MGTPEVVVPLLKFVQPIHRRARGCLAVFGAPELLPVMEIS
jgi:hypothetical protein